MESNKFPEFGSLWYFKINCIAPNSLPIVSTEAQDEFGDFLEAPANKIEVKKVDNKKPEEKKQEIKKDTIWDDAKDIMDMDDLMKPSGNKYGVGNIENSYGLMYDQFNQFNNQGFY